MVGESGQRGGWYLHVVENFEERERHAAADNHLVHLVQHALDELDLVSHLRSEHDIPQRS